MTSQSSLAGSDTTATAIRSTVLHIITNPQIVSLIAEISSFEDKQLISLPIQDSETRKMLYLQAVIKEGLRIFPLVTGLLSKYVPIGGDTVNGLFIPRVQRLDAVLGGCPVIV